MRGQRETIKVLDFGGQYSHLICRRVRECGAYSELVPYSVPTSELKATNTKGIIFSGGPASVYQKDAPRCDPSILDLNVPILGICYGLQLIVHLLGGRVRPSSRREYGRAELMIDDKSDLFKGFSDRTKCWMSHTDVAEALPEGFKPIARSENSPVAAFKDSRSRIFAVQFHPEVAHTPRGLKIIRNFISGICRCRPSWTIRSFVEEAVADIRRKVGSDRVLCAISGGVDSTTTAALVHRAIGKRLTCIFVDHGLLRRDEAEGMMKTFQEHLKLKPVYVDASEGFLKKLKGVADPELKRKIIGEEFVRVFAEESAKVGRFKWLAQGTLYPDIIESAKTGSPASRIKTHHNVAGLPETMEFQLLEPLRELYKDEARRVARLLGLPDKIVRRHPFPGPGLAVRIMGEVTPEKLRICSEASRIVEEELKESRLYDEVWQAFAIVGDDKAVGVIGDERKYGYVVTVRVVDSVDAMTADWSHLPYGLLERISNRITNEVQGVTLVTYAVSSKPPSTIEPQ